MVIDMTDEAFKRAVEIQSERKELEKELALLNNRKEKDLVRHFEICKKLYELGMEFARL